MLGRGVFAPPRQLTALLVVVIAHSWYFIICIFIIHTIIEEAFGFAAAIRQSFEVRAIQRVGLLRVVVIVCGGGVVVLGLDGLGEV